MLQSDRFDQVHWHRWEDWYTSPRATPNEACQISPNLYEARNLQLAIAGRDSKLTVPQSPNVTGHALEHESDIAKPLDLLRVLGPCGRQIDNISPASGSALTHSAVASSSAFPTHARCLDWNRSGVRSLARSWRKGSRDGDEQRHDEQDRRCQFIL
jgi:hypothetical protein